MFWQFSCPQNLAILSITVILCFVGTFYQLFMTDRGSLLTSAIMTAYATYLCYSAITLDPHSDCNPTLGSTSQNWSQIMGMALTAISLCWTTWGVVHKITADEQERHPELKDALVGADAEAASAGDAGGAGGTRDNKAKVVMAESRAVTYTDTSQNSETPYRCCCYELSGDDLDTAERRSMLAQVSLVFMLISSYYAMVLTNWATERAGGNVSSQKEGNASMWIQASAQWIALLMYIWSLAAPDIFPDRDFS
jgi:hypothetical protein